MKRKTKLLLLVVIAMSSILGTYVINGCGDKKPIEDKVTFSIKGIVTNATTNAPLGGAWVHYVKDAHLDSVRTDDGEGRYVISGLTQTGWHTLHFTHADFGGMQLSVYGHVDSQTVDRNAGLYERNASVYGYLLSDPAGGSSVSKIDLGKAALDNPEPAGPAPAGTKVWLRIDSIYSYVNEYDYSERIPIDPALFETTTNAAGRFRFDNIPAVTGGYVRLITSQFAGGADSCFSSVETFLQLRYNDSVDAEFIRAPLCGEAPIVMAITPDPNALIPLDASITVTFSRPMNPATVSFSLYEGCYDAPAQALSTHDEWLGFDTTWSNSYRTVVIKPAILLAPDDELCLDISPDSKATNGKSLQGTHYWHWNTVEGMKFVGTNLDNFGTNCSNFHIDTTIQICFNMPPVLPTPSARYLNDTIIFKDDQSRDVAFTSSVSGNCLLINPTLALEQNRCYDLTFTIYAEQSERRTYNQSIITGCGGHFCSQVICSTLAKPSQFVVDMGTNWKADYNTTYLTFSWAKLPGVVTYQIYARDTHTNTTWIKVADNITPLDFVLHDGGSVNFTDAENQKFDVYKSDGEMITPFTDDNKIWFRVRGVNCKGEGPWSDSVMVDDQTSPTFCVNQDGDADNMNGATTRDIAIWINQDEYMNRDTLNNPVFTFVEAGGDPAYVLPTSAITWSWNNDMRRWDGTVKVPAGKGAAGDLLITKMKDNSGNEGTDTLGLGPIYRIWTKNVDGSDTNTVSATKGTNPNSWEAPNGRALWSAQTTGGSCASGYNPGCSAHFWVFRSYDGGTTWADSTDVTWEGDCEGDPWYNFNDIDDTLHVNNNAVLGFRRASGGIRWLSSKFTINGVKITKPDSLWAADSAMTIFDRKGTDSTAVPLRWSSYGIDTLYIGYRVNGAGALLKTDSVSVTPGNQTFNWYPPSRGLDYNARLFVWKKDGDSRPWDSTVQMFNVKHDTILVDDPGTTSTAIAAGSPYEIKWRNIDALHAFATAYDTTLPSKVSVYYAAHMPSLDTAFASEAKWRLIALDSANDGRQMWTPPDTVASNDCFLRIKDSHGRRYFSDPAKKFAIGGLHVTSPNAFHQELFVGTAPNITWTSTNGYAGNVDIDLDTIGNGTGWMNLVANTANDGTEAWPTGTLAAPWIKNGVPNWPNTHSLIRVKKNAGTIYDVSDSNFTIAGFIITDPTLPADTLFEDRIDTIDVTTIGTIAQYDVLMVSATAPAVNVAIATASNNVTKFYWTVPNAYTTPRTDVKLIIKNSAGVTADTVSNLILETPGITVTSPNGAETWQENTPHAITWTSKGMRSGLVTIEFSSNGGTTYSYLTSPTGVPNTGTWTWTTPNLTGGDLNNCLIRITEVYTGQGSALSDVSNAAFTVQDVP